MRFKNTLIIAQNGSYCQQVQSHLKNKFSSVKKALKSPFLFGSDFTAKEDPPAKSLGCPPIRKY